MGTSPITALACRHAFHTKCIAKTLRKKWAPDRRITFKFLDCPICRKQISLDYRVAGGLNQLLKDTVQDKSEIMDQVKQIAENEKAISESVRVTA